MALPTRPVSGASIESTWGQAVHDYTFAPAGCRAHSGSATTLPNSLATVKINLDVADDDPGGYVDTANDQVEIPTNGEGLYHLSVRCTQTSGTGSAWRFKIFINGSIYTHINFDVNSDGSQTQNAIGIDLPDMAAGDIVSIHGNKIGASGPDPNVSITHFQLRRVGAEYGAP